MRITTQMMNEACRKSGLPLPTSLLDHLRDSKTQGGLLDALQKNKNTQSVSLQRKHYEELGEKADSLSSSASFLLSKTSAIKKEILESDDHPKLYNDQEVYKKLQELTDHFNALNKQLEKSNGTLIAFYKKSLVDAGHEHAEALKELGITVSKSGELTFDQEKVKSVSHDAFSKNLEQGLEFIKKVGFIASKVSDFADRNVESFGSQYSANGNLYFSNTNKYNFWS